MPTITPPRSTPDYEAADALVIAAPEQLRALGDDVRSKIVALLRERAWSTQELSHELGIPKGTVAHHLKVLERAGLIRIVRTRRIRAVTEKYYGRVAHLFLFEFDDPAAARSVGAAALRRAAEGLERAPEWANFGYVRVRLAPDDAKRLERRLDRLVDAFRSCDTEEGRLFGFATALWPAEASDA